MERERANISGRFPEDYGVYAANVPAFVPRVTAWRNSTVQGNGFSPALYMKHGEWKAGATYILAMAWLALRMKQGL